MTRIRFLLGAVLCDARFVGLLDPSAQGTTHLWAARLDHLPAKARGR